ncbi:MAG: hypothetical protein JOZ19_06475 [Rubrobacter sp.]|nr:hypothetical protein [Rubrobacter sp.]
MRRRFGRRRSTRRRTFSGAVLVLGVGALVATIVFRRRREAATAIRESYETAGEHFGEARERETRYATELSERVTGNLRAGAESAQVASQELAEQIQESGPEVAGKVLDQANTVEAEENRTDDLRRIISESVQRSRGEA